MIDKSYPRSVIADGWLQSGLFPFNIRTILSRFDQFIPLSEIDQTQLLCSVLMVGSIAMESGCIPEDTMKKYAWPVYQGESSNNRDYSTCPLNYMRAVWANHEESIKYQKQYKSSKMQNQNTTANNSNSSSDPRRHPSSSTTAGKLKKCSNYTLRVDNIVWECNITNSCTVKYCKSCNTDAIRNEHSLKHTRTNKNNSQRLLQQQTQLLQQQEPTLTPTSTENQP
jgi:hypothetical protein